MQKDEVWGHTVHARSAMRGVLADLSDDEWEQPSLCAGWRVRDTAAHLIANPQMGLANTSRAMAGMWRGYNEMVRRDGLRRGRAPVADILAQYDEWAAVRRRPVTVTHVEPLVDAIVHAQDVVRPLGRTLPVPAEAAAVAADRVRLMAPLFGTRSLLSRVKLVATDIDWERGSGREVRAPMVDLLMLAAGRPGPKHAGD